MTLTFDDFLKFVSTTECHYCGRTVVWPERAFVKTARRQYARSSKAYYLDRINNDVGYTKSNCVVCCTTCNAIKGNTLTYEEMLILKPSLKKLAIRQNA